MLRKVLCSYGTLIARAAAAFSCDDRRAHVEQPSQRVEISGFSIFVTSRLSVLLVVLLKARLRALN